MKRWIVLALAGLAFSSPAFSEHGGGFRGGEAVIEQMKGNIQVLLGGFQFEDSKITKITELAEWTVRASGNDPSVKEKLLQDFRWDLKRGFSYDLKNKWVSENPRVSLEERLHQWVRDAVEQVLRETDGGALPPDTGRMLTAHVSFAFYRVASWPPRYSPYPPYYYPFPGPSKRGTTITGRRNSIYHQCLNVISSYHLDYLVGVRANRKVLGYGYAGEGPMPCEVPSSSCGMPSFAPEEACQFVALNAS